MKEEQKIKQIKKIQIKLKVFLYTAIIIAVILLISISPLFNVKNIEFSDTSDEIKQNIKNILNEAEGKNGFLYISENVSGIKNIDYMLELRAKDIEDKIMFSIPELKNVKVKFDFPNTLKISFGERIPAYLVKFAGAYICVDIDGFILSVHTDKEERDLPVISGITIQEYKIGQYLSLKNNDQIRILKSIFTEIYSCDNKDSNFQNSDNKDSNFQNSDFKLSSCIETVEVSEYNDIWLFIDDNITARLGDIDNIEYKIPALKEILLSGNVLGNKGKIDFTTSDRPVFKPEI